MNLNSHCLVLFKNPRDQLQVSYLARQMHPHNSGQFMDKFQKATTKPYGCLVVDLKQDTPDMDRLKSGSVFDQQMESNISNGQPIGNTYTKTIKEQDEQARAHLQTGSQTVDMSQTMARAVHEKKGTV